MKVLLIMSAGKNSRFGYKPKALAKIKNHTNIEHTYEKVKDKFDKIIVCVPEGLSSEYDFLLINKNVEVIEVVGGNGELYSIFDCFKKLRQKFLLNKDTLVAVCWGDAYFFSEKPFEEFMNQINSENTFCAVSENENPYAWFETENGFIKKSHFRKDNSCEKGTHDQCLFAISYKSYEYIEKYSKEFISRKELKLLEYFEWAYVNGYEKVSCCFITPNQVKSFNTPEELNYIEEHA